MINIFLFSFLNAECSKMLQSPPPAGPPLHPRVRVAQPLYSIFTSSPVRTSLKKPIFKGKSPPHPNQHLQTSDFEDKEGKKITSLPKEAEAGLLKQESIFREVEEKSDAVTAVPDCEEEHPAAASAHEEDEDEIIFFTPELFESKDNDVGPQNETTTEFPPRPRSPAVCSDELLEQGQGQASFDGQGTISGSERKKPQGEREGFRGQKEGGQVDNQSRKTESWHHRVSRSRQKVPSYPPGK